MKQLWRLQSWCTHLQEHMSGVMSVRETLLHLFLSGNGEAKPPPAHSDWSKTGFKKQKQKQQKKKPNKPSHSITKQFKNGVGVGVGVGCSSE